MAGKMFEIEPQRLIEEEKEACVIWYQDMKLGSIMTWGDMVKYLILGTADERHEIVTQNIIIPIVKSLGVRQNFDQGDWNTLLEDLVTKGWGVYESDTRLFLWSPDVMATRPVEEEDREDNPNIPPDNIRFITDIMQFSPYGAMSQLVVMAALSKYVDAVVGMGEEQLVKDWGFPLFNPRAWYLTCADIKGKLDKRAGNPANLEKDPISHFIDEIMKESPTLRKRCKTEGIEDLIVYALNFLLSNLDQVEEMNDEENDEEEAENT